MNESTDPTDPAAPMNANESGDVNNAPVANDGIAQPAPAPSVDADSTPAVDDQTTVIVPQHDPALSRGQDVQPYQAPTAPAAQWPAATQENLHFTEQAGSQAGPRSPQGHQLFDQYGRPLIPGQPGYAAANYGAPGASYPYAYGQQPHPYAAALQQLSQANGTGNAFGNGGNAANNGNGGFGGYGNGLGPNGQPAVGPRAPKPPMKRGMGWIIAAASTAAAVGVIAGIGGIAALASQTAQIAAAQHETSQLAPSQKGNGGQSFGNGSGGSGGSGSDPYMTQPQSATPNTRSATAAESVGVVDINTDLAYQGAAAAGTGMILTADGQILTNNHVIAGATSITVTVVSTGQQYTAKVVGTDATADVAVLQLDNASGLTPITIDSDGGVAVGDAVTGVGNAGGKGGTPTAAEGTVTALDQSITVQDEQTGQGKNLTGLIQTDADIQAGDSGGPLYDSEGEVVGIDTAASSGGTDIDGFAIPIDDALSIVKQIESGVETDTVSIGYPAFIGIGLAADGAAGANGQAVVGATVSGVIANTPAASAGLAAGDVITALNGVAIDSGSTLTATMKGLQPGQTVSITWTDTAGTSHTADITLIEGPAA
jgi:S1-C subfamily serine protease